MPLIECVPNFSEGRRPEVLAALAESVRATPGARLLDQGMDADHNRAVLTFAGAPAAMEAAAFTVCRTALEHIDLRAHVGVHPRFGAIDVCPFIPLGDTSEASCVERAHALGARLGDELGLPIFFYGAAARVPERASLPALRRELARVARPAQHSGGAQGAGFRPDVGPARPHPTGGALALGVRTILIAYNIDLETPDVTHAHAIAARIRERDGGLPGIRALGFHLESVGRAQVSMNVCDYRKTGLVEVFEAVERLARERGVAVRGSELIGLAPRAALDADIAARIALTGFDPRRHVIETLLESS